MYALFKSNVTYSTKTVKFDSAARNVLTVDLGMRRVAAIFVPKLLSPEQQQLRLEVTWDMLEGANRDPEFLKTMINGDEA
jgi:hypothetical protein